jgi:catechol 2,3-dioxygenase-like lactoylglutathione lyase family enzyme
VNGLTFLGLERYWDLSATAFVVVVDGGPNMENPMLKPTGLLNGHYECRSLTETLPIFTDLLAVEIIEQKNSEATLKHPNTDWRLVVHEGGPNAPEKTSDNHYGFRVGSHQEIEAAWEYLEANKEKYRLRHVTKPQKSHYAYSVYFREPGGNTIEIEYYNPGAAQHGRSHTARHWETPLANERFPGRGYIPQALSHGTLQCDDAKASRRFYTEVLGLEIAGGYNMSQYIKHAATPWYIVVLPRSPRQYLAPTNRFTFQLTSPAEVEKAHREFTANGRALGVTEVRNLEEAGDQLSFIFSDLDRNWWELTAEA